MNSIISGVVLDSSIQSVFLDILDRLNKPDNIKRTKIILHYAATFPAPYSETAAAFGVSREYIFKVLNQEAASLPWLQELIQQQSEMYYKGDYSKELRKSGNNKKGTP